MSRLSLELFAEARRRHDLQAYLGPMGAAISAYRRLELSTRAKGIGTLARRILRT